MRGSRESRRARGEERSKTAWGGTFSSCLKVCPECQTDQETNLYLLEIQRVISVLVRQREIETQQYLSARQ